MRRFFFLLLSVWRQQLQIYFIAGLIGAVIGILVLAPTYDYLSARTQELDPFSSLEYVLIQINDILRGKGTAQNIGLVSFYAEVGGIIGLISLFFYRMLNERLVKIDYLKLELDKDLATILRQGEGPYLEFKSSLRWDVMETRVNRNLETVILKTLAGFLNSHIGGTLLIGVADNGQVLGLAADFQTLKRPDQDGFEQTLIAAISSHLGADICRFIHILFHVLENKVVCRVIVSPASRPVYLIQGNCPKFYVRTGGSTRELNVQEALDYAPLRWKLGK